MSVPTTTTDEPTTITCDCCHGTVNEDESDGGICNDCYPICSAGHCGVLGEPF